MRLVRLAVAIVALGLGASPAESAPPEARLLARLAAPWPRLQRADGTFRDAVLARTGPAGRDPYGTAMMGYALLAAGLRGHDARETGAGLRAIGHAVAHPVATHRIFEGLALASAYPLARRSLAGDPRFAALRPAWEARLRAVTVVQIGRRPYSNWNAVEALELLELARSGLRPDAVALRRTAHDVFDRVLPAHLARGGILSDPPWEPLAYHAFTTALLARALRISGPGGLAPAARRTLTRAVGGTAALASPLGDVAYLGRSDEEAWTLAMTDAASRSAGRADLGRAAVARLASAYPGATHGLGLTPSDAIPALDSYAAAASYAGLTMAGLEWALEARRVAAAPPARAPRSALLGSGNGAFGVVRTPTIWFAVREQPGVAVPGRSLYVRDLRYDAGLAALARRTGGRWRALLPARPRTTTARGAAALTVMRGTRTGRLSGAHLALTRGGRALTLIGAWRTAAGRSLGRALVSYRAIACGVAMRISAPAGDRLRLVVRSRRAGAPARLRGARVTRGAPERSSSDSRVVPFVFTIVARGAPVDVTVCPRP